MTFQEVFQKVFQELFRKVFQEAFQDVFQEMVRKVLQKVFQMVGWLKKTLATMIDLVSLRTLFGPGAPDSDLGRFQIRA